MSAVRLGQPLNRVDGRAKVTGTAKYSAEFTSESLTHGFVIASAIARGKIEEIDADEALAVPGVIHVLTHENRPKLPWFDRSYRDQDAPAGSPFRPLYDEEIHFSGQPIALVVAESFEIARYAASLVRVRYREKEHRTNLHAALKDAYHPKPRPLIEPTAKPRGHADKALANAKHRINAEYRSPTEYHNPLEPHACTVLFQPDGTLVVYDKTQGVFNSQSYVCKVFDLAKDKVRVVSPFVGGAFGVALRPQHSLFLAVMAALECKRDVRVVLTRQQTFALGHRPETLQTLSLGADETGKLVAVKHSSIAETSRAEDYTEVVVNWSGNMYQCSNVAFDQKVVDLDVATPIDMRAPGAALGVYALESAIDELAHAAGVDPLEMRLRNYAERDQNNDKPFSSKELRACYAQGADRFGWHRRTAAPRSMQEGRSLIGWGMATGAWEAMQMPARCKARLSVDGKLVVESGTADIGTGTYTVMSQIAAATLGLPIEDVTFTLGDTALPMAPLQGGSWTVASVGSAVEEVCRSLGGKLLAFAKKMEHSPLGKAHLADVVFEEGHVCLAKEPTQRVSFGEAMRHAGVLFVEDDVTAIPNVVEQKGYTRATHSAVFVEVSVDEDLGTIRVRRVVSAIAGGKIINAKTARSQILGAVVWGLGMALEEEALVDHTLGRVMNHSLAEYHLLVHADVPEIEVIFVEEKDTIVNPLGAKGLGEIGIVGVAAAVANAVFHATGKRVRDLPITLDKVR